MKLVHKTRITLFQRADIKKEPNISAARKQFMGSLATKLRKGLKIVFLFLPFFDQIKMVKFEVLPLPHLKGVKKKRQKQIKEILARHVQIQDCK